MPIRTENTVAAIAVAHPETIRVFQKLGIDFCCGGKIPLDEACAKHGLDPKTVLNELCAAQPAEEDRTDWQTSPLPALTAHIQARYHEPLRDELARLATMLERVLDRHGERLPETLVPLQATFASFRRDLIDHMGREDAVLFPLIGRLDAPGTSAAARAPMRAIAACMSAEHDAAGASLAAMRRITNDYAAPTWACPTFLGLYHGLAALEREMQVHVHLENAILFPRAMGERVRSTS